VSYILDALKRAERERTLGKTPAALDEVAPPPPLREESPDRRWLLILIAVILLAAAAGYFGYALRGGAAPATTAATAPAPAPVIPAPAPAPAPTAAADTAAGYLDDETYARTHREARIADGSNLNSLDDLTGTAQPTPAPTPTPAVSTELAAASPPPAVVAPPPAVATPAPQLNTERTPPPQSGTEVKTLKLDPAYAPAPTPALPAPAPSSFAPAPAAASEPSRAHDPRLSGLRQLKEMPAAYRNDFPAFSVDVHVYNETGSRFVIINGQRYHEADTLAAGPRIVEIVPEGLVLEWRGEKVLYALNR